MVAPIRHLKGRKILVTGHTGFKGAWLSLWLQMLGGEVVGYALPPPTSPSLFDLADVQEGMCSIIGDIRHAAALRTVVRQHQPEIIFHLAGQSIVRRSYQDPVETYGVNVLGTVHVLECARLCDSVKSVLVITSDKCYENTDQGRLFREIDPLGGRDPYSSSKACAELVAAAYQSSFFSETPGSTRRAGVATARAGNVLGGGDWAEDRLVPDVMRAFLDGRRVLIRNPDAVRPWQHVLDALNGYLALLERMSYHAAEYAQAWNFGPDRADAQPVSWVVDRVARMWGPEADWELDRGLQPQEASSLSLDSSKSREKLDWTPRLALAEALQWTVDWYKAYQQGKDMRQFTEEQIIRFLEFR
ncbi:MAG: CDP-glucose 4,6-dehydratase [Desulfomonile tiedjei]|nr:CDP-glucose 4,6-dehydratase [Desulfomonile tiedjei]